MKNRWKVLWFAFVQISRLVIKNYYIRLTDYYQKALWEGVLPIYLFHKNETDITIQNKGFNLQISRIWRHLPRPLPLPPPPP